MKKKVKNSLVLFLVMFVIFGTINLNALEIEKVHNISSIGISFLEENWCQDLNVVWRILGYLKNVAYVATPIILIVTGAIGLLKAAASQNEGKIKKAQDVLIKKIISAVCVFLVITVVEIVLDLVADNNWRSCADCFINPTNCGTESSENSVSGKTPGSTSGSSTYRTNEKN